MPISFNSYELANKLAIKNKKSIIVRANTMFSIGTQANNEKSRILLSNICLLLAQFS